MGISSPVILRKTLVRAGAGAGAGAGIGIGIGADGRDMKLFWSAAPADCLAAECPAKCPAVSCDDEALFAGVNMLLNISARSCHGVGLYAEQYGGKGHERALSQHGG